MNFSHRPEWSMEEATPDYAKPKAAVLAQQPAFVSESETRVNQLRMPGNWALRRNTHCDPTIFIPARCAA
jgi:hypothetical protein